MPEKVLPLLERIREYFQAAPRYRPHSPWYRDDLPDVPTPTLFQPDVPVTGGPEAATLVQQLLNLDPRVKARVSRVTVGPGRASMVSQAEEGEPVEGFSDLRGAYNRESRDIAVNPAFGDDVLFDLFSTLTHEMGHAAGYGEKGATEGSRMVRTASDPDRAVVAEYLRRVARPR